MNVEQVIRDYLPDVLHMSLATSAGEQPWVCEVHFVFDEELNLYFRSKPSRRHSQEITINPSVAGNIVKSHARGEKVRGVYFEGRATQIEVDEPSPIVALFRDRVGLGPDIVADAKEPDGHKFYQVSVSTYYLFDSQQTSPSKKYELPWHG